MHKASLTILFVLFVTACNPIPPEPRIEPSSSTAASTYTPVASGTEPTPTPTATALPATVLSLDVAGPKPLTSIGETAQLSVTANMSDGSSRAVENALVQWGSSDPAVVSVSDGVVVAVGGGNATITASYRDLTAEVIISAWISTLSEGSVRVLYVIPADRDFRTEYSHNIARAIADVQGWYRRQLDGLTFEIYSVIPEPCHLLKGEDYYSHGDVWAKVLTDVQSCAPVRHGAPLFRWVLYVDASELGHCGEPFELGRGGDGLAMFAREDLELMQNPGTTHVYCDIGAYARSYGSVLGGLAHELAHTLNVPHPPGCDPWDPTNCDEQETWSLMHDGYQIYPETYLLPSDKETLIRSPFFDGEPIYDRDSLGALSQPTIRGAVLGPDGESSGGLWVSLIADSFWGWGVTGRDGTFEIRLPDESSGMAILSIHSGDLGDCGWRGYYGPGGFTTQRNWATRVEVGGENVTGIEVRLPILADQLCNRQSTSTIRGIMTTPEGQPVEGVWLWVVGAADLGAFTDSRGAFAIEVPDGSYGLLLEFGNRIVGWYDGKGITADQSEAAVLEVAGEDIEDIEIRLPARPEDLP